MRKKIVLFAAAGLLTTASIVAATTVNTGKKPTGKAVKTETAKEKKSTCNRARTHCFD